MAISQPTLQDIQQQLDAISKVVESFQPLMSNQPEPEADPSPEPEPSPTPKHLHTRMEFNGEPSRLAELTLIHLWTQNELGSLYDCECDECPRVDALCHDILQPDINAELRDVALLYGGMDALVNCYKKAVHQTCMLDAFICCFAVTMPNFGTADVLNSLHYMGSLGAFIAHDLFGQPVSALMAADTKEQPNQIRKRALATIGNRIKKAFIPAGLQICQDKKSSIIKNPHLQNDKTCTMYCLPDFYMHQPQLPF